MAPVFTSKGSPLSKRVESAAFHAGDRVGQSHHRQRGAIPERLIADGIQLRRKYDAHQGCAAPEGLVADGGKALRAIH